MVYCQACGSENADTAKFCVKCGTAVRGTCAGTAGTDPGTQPVQGDGGSWRWYYARGCLGVGSMLIAAFITVVAVTTFCNYPVVDVCWLGVAALFFLLGRKYWPKG